MTLEFDWDEQKRKKNIEKHGIDFFDAAKIFWGNTVQKVSKQEYNDSEERILATGKIGDDILTVVYVRRGNIIRIISARKARDNERRKYQSIYPSLS
jgi:hypothetical protein